MLIEEQRRIFDELRQINPEIVDDGITDENAYLSAGYHLMYVLKEVNGGSGWSLCEHLRSGGRQQAHDATWDNIARWTEGILSLPKDIPWSELESNCKNRRERMLLKICAINVKKTSGGNVSNEKTIYTEALNNSDILQKQLKLYVPDIVICCGTDEAFVNACFHDKKTEWKMTSRGIWYFRDGKMVVIAFSHPAARVRDCYLYYALLDAVREILGIVGK